MLSPVIYFDQEMQEVEQMKSEKLGPILLSGFMIGPILGSGIIILPPLVFEETGDYAIFAWVIMMVMSFLFAYLFSKISIRFPGDSGAAQAVEFAFGQPFRHLSANFLIMAVCLGPIAVLSTASEYLQLWLGVEYSWFTFGLLLLCYGVVSMNVTSVGRISFVLSSAISLVLVTGSLAVLFFFRGAATIETSFEWPSFGYSLLLLFWCLVGWEIIGNYSGEVRDPERTIPKAIVYSILLIAMVSLSVAAAVQWMDPSLGNRGSGKLDMILYPLFGSYAVPLMTLITTALCMSTALMVIGGVSRLICAQAEKGVFPSILVKRTKSQVPYMAMLALFIIHISVFILSSLGWVTLKQLVAIADAFFLCNALLGILAAYRLFQGIWIRLIAVILAIAFTIILMFSSTGLLVGIFTITVWTGVRTYQSRTSGKEDLKNCI